jgi:hypothetical protein
MWPDSLPSPSFRWRHRADVFTVNNRVNGRNGRKRIHQKNTARRRFIASVGSVVATKAVIKTHIRDLGKIGGFQSRDGFRLLLARFTLYRGTANYGGSKRLPSLGIVPMPTIQDRGIPSHQAARSRSLSKSSNFAHRHTSVQLIQIETNSACLLL